MKQRMTAGMRKVLIILMIGAFLIFAGCANNTTTAEKITNSKTSNLEIIYDEVVGSSWEVAKIREKDTGNIIYLMDGTYSGAMVVINAK